LAEVGELRTQLARVEQAGDSPVGPNYVTKFREYKYRETLFELFARQYEVARVDESREGPLIQVLDVATPPEWKSKPKRLFNAVLFTLLSFMLLALFILVRHFLPGWAADPARADQIGRLRTVFGRR
jgi:capsule polysaccharide export protein KpsE/RkpR